MSQHFCLGGGVLSGEGILSREPFDFAFETLSVTVACNHLKCPSCGEIVRVLDGVTADSSLAHNLQAAFSASDLGKWVRPLAGSRVYLCRDQSLSVAGDLVLDVPPELGENPSWRCAGHPLLTLPGRIDGEILDENIDLAALVARAFAGRLSPSAAAWKGDWVGRLHAVVPAEVAERVAEAALSCVLSDEPLVAVRAVLFFTTHPTLAQAGRLPELYARDPERFSRIQNPAAAGRDLRYWLLQSLAMRLKAVPDDAGALALARDCAIGPGDKPLQLLGALQDVDDAWVQKHLSAIKLANPDFSP
jgi:hypothetical protein